MLILTAFDSCRAQVYFDDVKISNFGSDPLNVVMTKHVSIDPRKNLQYEHGWSRFLSIIIFFIDMCGKFCVCVEMMICHMNQKDSQKRNEIVSLIRFLCWNVSLRLQYSEWQVVFFKSSYLVGCCSKMCFASETFTTFIWQNWNCWKISIWTNYIKFTKPTVIFIKIKQMTLQVHVPIARLAWYGINQLFCSILKLKKTFVWVSINLQLLWSEKKLKRLQNSILTLKRYHIPPNKVQNNRTGFARVSFLRSNEFGLCGSIQA